MDLSDIEGHFWTIKEELATVNERIDLWEEKLIEQQKKINRLKKDIPKPSESPSRKIANRWMHRIARIKSRLKGHLKGVWAIYLPAIDLWIFNNHSGWSMHDLYIHIEELRNWEVMELEGIMGITDE